MTEPARPTRPKLDVDTLFAGLRAGQHAALGRAITLVESSLPAHRALADDLLTRCLPFTGGSLRVGVTGVPGVGKSTFIEAFGQFLTARGHRVAVLAVDPSSSVTGGSILGDKTRMQNLCADPNAFIRPSPSACTLGGVASKTRETLLLCEAAGFDVVLVETVGVGQSETVVADMTDFFLALMLPGAGDELQGIKRGLLELADLIAVNKADGDNEVKARLAARAYQNALHLTRPEDDPDAERVLICSALTGLNLDRILKAMEDHRTRLQRQGRFEARRREQALRWMESLVSEGLKAWFEARPGVEALSATLTSAIRQGTLPAPAAAAKLLSLLG